MRFVAVGGPCSELVLWVSFTCGAVCLCLSSSGRWSDFKTWLPVPVERAELCVDFPKQDLRFSIQISMTFVFFFLGSRC